MSSHCEKGKHCTKLCKQEEGLQDMRSNPALPSIGPTPAGTPRLALGLILQWRCKAPRESPDENEQRSKAQPVRKG